MRIPRTGLALICAAAIAGCHREKKAAPASSEPAAVAQEQMPAPAWPRPEAWLVKLDAPAVELRATADDESPPRKPVHPDPASAISDLVAANGNLAPATGAELTDALHALGDFVQLPVSFSSVALDSGLTRPRVVFAVRTRTATAPANKPDFTGRLFLAANMATDRTGENARVKAIEFISWNNRRLKFDFGVIEIAGGEPELKFLDGVRCFTCHKNRGPILGVTPWSNTVHNPAVASASTVRFGRRTLDDFKLGARDVSNVSIKVGGVQLLHSEAEAVDRVVRIAADRLFERSLVEALAKSPPGRVALAQLLASLSMPGAIETLDERTAKAMNAADMSRYLYDATALRKSPSSELLDVDPESLMGSMAKKREWWSISPADVLKYDDLRAGGEHRLGEKRTPSNPRAFQPRKPKVIRRATETITGAMVVRAIGLTDADRVFLHVTLHDASLSASYPRTWPVTSEDLAQRIFNGPHFADVLASGVLPDRDDFKDRFVAGLGESLAFHGHTGKYWISRERYASGPKRIASRENENEIPDVLPTTACLGCHDIAKPGVKAPFNPIPSLAFDPFDAAGREAWVKSTDSARRTAVLNRLLKRLGQDRDMPPEDSAEHEIFREKSPESFHAATEFLERELRRARQSAGR